MSLQFLIVWSLLMGANAAWILWPEGDQGSGQVLASLKSSVGKIEVRRAGNFVWAPSASGARYFSMDSIATGSSSKATLLLVDGTEILLPEDTQLKIQRQVMDQGIEIAVIRGGVSVQKAPPSKSKKSAAAKPLAINTSRYRIDLTALKGMFSLGANSEVTATHAEDIVIQGKQEAIKLTDMIEEGVTVLSDSISSTVIEVSQVEEPKVLPPPPPPPPKPALAAKPAPPLALIAEPVDELIQAEWQAKVLHLWSAGKLQELREQPFKVPSKWKMADNPRWETVVKIQDLQSQQILLLKRNLREHLEISIADLESIIQPQANDISLSLQAGLVKKADELSKAVFSPLTSTLVLHGLHSQKPVTVSLDKWELGTSKDAWFAGSPLLKAKIVIHLLDPKFLTELEGYLRGAGGFKIEPLRKVPTQGFGLIKGPRLIGFLDELAEPLQGSLSKDLDLDLIFKGTPTSYLGGKGQFDLMKYLETSSEVYYIRRGLTLKLDASLFKSQAAAREFIKRFNPYFFNEKVEIIYAPEP